MSIKPKPQVSTFLIDIIIAGSLPIINTLDFYAGESLSLFLLYVFPVFASSWSRGRLYGMFYALLCSFSWLYTDLILHTVPMQLHIVLFVLFSRISLFALMAWLFSGYNQLYNDLKDQAYKDSKTGAYNYRAFITFAEREQQRASRIKTSLVLAYFDMDKFKNINDEFGHAMGDQVLIEFSQIAQNSLRQIDIFARIGGDEFIALFVNTTVEQAVSILERIKDSFEKSMQSKNLQVTISIGVTSFDSDRIGLDEAIHQADQLMYQAKSEGQNRIFSF